MPQEQAPIEVLPGEGVQGARFGEDRATHRERFGTFESFERNPGDGLTDMYPGKLLMLYYDKEDKLTFIEVSAGGAEVVWDGVSLVGQPLGTVLEALRAKGVEPEFDDDSTFELPEQGIGLFTTAPDELDEPVEGVSVHPVGQG